MRREFRECLAECFWVKANQEAESRIVTITTVTGRLYWNLRTYFEVDSMTIGRGLPSTCCHMDHIPGECPCHMASGFFQRK